MPAGDEQAPPSPTRVRLRTFVTVAAGLLATGALVFVLTPVGSGNTEAPYAAVMAGCTWSAALTATIGAAAAWWSGRRAAATAIAFVTAISLLCAGLSTSALRQDISSGRFDRCRHIRDQRSTQWWPEGSFSRTPDPARPGGYRLLHLGADHVPGGWLTDEDIDEDDCDRWFPAR